MFELRSIAFKDKQLIPVKYSCDGSNISPPLYWKNVPNNTKSFILIMDDPDAPHGTCYHWIIYNIPRECSELAEGIKTSSLPIPAQLAPNNWHHKNYHGPCPPHGEEHNYHFKLFALKSFIEHDQDISSKKNIEIVINKLSLSKAILIGKYSRIIEDSTSHKEDIKDAITILGKKDVNQEIKEKSKKEITKKILDKN